MSSHSSKAVANTALLSVDTMGLEPTAWGLYCLPGERDISLFHVSVLWNLVGR